MTDVKRLPALVSLQHLSFQFANGETLLADVNLSIDQTPTGIVGRNGRGKSILAKLMAGVLLPSSGTLKNRPMLPMCPRPSRFKQGKPSPISPQLPRLGCP